MKTKKTGGKAIKSINNVQKTTLRATAVIAMIFLSSFVLNAQGSEEFMAWNSSKEKTVKLDHKVKNDAVGFNGVTYSKARFNEFNHQMESPDSYPGFLCLKPA